MAGIAKPNEEIREAKYTLLGGVGSQGAQPSGLFNGIPVNEWNTANVMYWYSGGEYVEVEIDEKSNIWRAGTTNWSTYLTPLMIKKYNLQTLVFDDVSSIYPQKLSAINEKQWEKTIENLPSGRYRFETKGARIDSEWFIESVVMNKSLILSNGEYKKYIGSKDAFEGANLIPIK